MSFDSGRGDLDPLPVSGIPITKLSVPLAAALAALCAALAPGIASAAGPDLSVSMSASPNPAMPGDYLSVNVTTRNNGDAPAPGAYIAVLIFEGGNLAETDQCVNFFGRLAVCSVGTLQPGESARRTVLIKDLQVGDIHFQANTGSDVIDAAFGDNATETTITVERRADLSLGLELGRNSAASSANATLVATVRNSSAGIARDAMFRLTLEKGIRTERLPSDCKRSGLEVKCDLGTLDARSSATRLIPLRARSKRAFSLLGGVSWSGQDATPEDNLAQVLLSTYARTRKVNVRTLVRGLSRKNRCISKRRLRLRVRIPRGSAVSRTYIYVRGKRVRLVRGTRLRKRVNLKRLPRGFYTLRVQTILKNGERRIGHRLLRACGTKFIR